MEQEKNKEKEARESQLAMLNILEDIEEARKSIRRERDTTRAIIDNLVDGLLVFDEENKISLINPQAEKFLQIKAKRIVGNSPLKTTGSAALRSLAAFLGKEIKKAFREEFQIKKKLTLEITTAPLLTGGKITGNVVILHDITREKIIERLKTEFVSLSAHQLRTPLSAIKWALKMVISGDVGEITKAQKEFLEKSYQSNERMINLINDLLDVTRVEEGRFLYKPAFSDLDSVAQFVVNSSRDEINRKKIKVKINAPKNKLPKVLIDVGKIRLAIQNLLDNSLKYTFRGGKVIISVKESNKELEFSIKDNGIGIAKEQQNKVFNKFFRGDNAAKIETEGSGLGLFITKNIIEAHRGKIWFDSKVGRGTTFYFTLPIPKAAKVKIK